MKIDKKSIYFYLFLILSVCLSTFCWKLINLPLSDNEIIGNYSQNNFNALNDVFRYVIFISIPILYYFVWKLIIEKKKINDFLLNIKFKKEKIYYDNNTYIIYLLFIFFITLEFLSVKFPINEIDMYHEGQRLSSAFKSKLDGTLWSGSYVTVGVIYEILGPKYIWKIFNNESISLIRFLDIFFVFVTKFLLIYLSFEISKNINLKLLFKNLFFIVLSIIALKCINYNSSADLIEYREIPVLLTLVFFIRSLKNINELNLSYIFLGFLTVFTFFWSVDRAIVLNLLILFIIIFLIINKNYKNVVIIIISSIFFWLFFYFLLKEEFIFFVANTITTFKEMSEINGLIHPTPFSDDPNSSRSTKTILSILISLLISLSFFFEKKNKLSYSFKISLLAISLVSFLSYLYALGRTDYTHLKQVFGFPIVFLSCYLLYYFFYFFLRQFNFNKYNGKKFLITLIPLTLLFFANFNVNYLKIINFKNRFFEYIKLKDHNFLTKADNIFVKNVSSLVKNEKCIQLYTNDTALLYLLKLPNCTKYYMAWTVGSKKNQIDLIKNLNSTNFIIKNGTTDQSMILHKWGLSLDVKYPLITDYINRNFKNELVVGNRKILFR